MPFELTPCEPWATTEDVLACDSYADLDPDAIESKIAVADDVLCRLSGLQFMGLCTDVVRPLATCCTYTPYGHGYEFDVEAWPVTEVVRVLIDGNELDLNLVRVFDGRVLVRMDGLPWPVAQRLDLPTSSVGTWELTYKFGQRPPPSGVLASAVLAGELTLACGTEDECKRCKLSRRVQTVARQGVSMTLLDPFQFLDRGRLGIMEIDEFITAYNPEKLLGEPTIASPDLQNRMVRQTWP